MLDNFRHNFIKGWSILWKPQMRLRELLVEGHSRIRLLLIFLGGILLIQFWADIMNLGDNHPIGKIMSVSLLLGPILGLLLILAATFWLMLLGNWMDTSSSFTFRKPWINPPIPLRWLLWNRIFGYKKVNQALETGWLRPYKKAWSAFWGMFAWIGQRLGSGKWSYGRVMVALVRTFSPMLLAGILFWFELAYFDGLQLTTVAEVPGVWILTGTLKTLLIAWSFCLWYPLVKEAFSLTGIKAIGVAAAGCLGASVLVFGLLYLLGVPLFG